jgi:hypothetical protein
MMVSVILLGQLATNRNDGVLQRRNTLGQVVEVEWLAPVGYLRRQPKSVPVLIDHDPGWRVGEVVYLQRSKLSGLLAFCSVNDDMGEMLSGEPLFLSSGVTALSLKPGHHERALLSEVSIVPHTAACGTKPIEWSSTTGAPRSMPLLWREAWRDGIEELYERKNRSDPRLMIRDVDQLDAVDEMLTDPASVWWKRHPAAQPAPAVRSAPASDEPLDKVYRHHVGGCVVALN